MRLRAFLKISCPISNDDFCNVPPNALALLHLLPGLHNLEIYAEQSLCARGWSATRAALDLQILYGCLPLNDANTKSFVHYNGNVYCLGEGVPLPCFLNEVEAEHEDISVLMTEFDEREGGSIMVLNGRCAEELVPGSQNRGSASQFAWTFRWAFAMCRRGRIGWEHCP